MNVDKLFRKLKAKWEAIKKQTENNIENYLNSLINNVNINNPHYIQSLPNFYFYNLVKEKTKIFLNEIEFECKRCVESCCFFLELEYNSKAIGIQIFKEDYELLKNGEGDLNGYIIKNNIYSSANTEIQQNLDYGYLDIIKKQDNFQCYYYDEKRLECKIHKYRPLICFTYPFRFIKRDNGIDLIIFDSCAFIKNNVENNTLKKFAEKIIKRYSYWEFWIALSLFLKYIQQYGRERKIN